MSGREPTRREGLMCQDSQSHSSVDVRIRVSEMEAVRREAHRILREDPPKGHVHQWFPRVLRRANENVKRRRKWVERKAV